MYFKYYVPSLISLGLALFFLWFPSFAVALVVGGFLSFAIFYAFFISKIIQARFEAGRSSQNRARAGTTDVEPTFRHVAVTMVKKTDWFRE